MGQKNQKINFLLTKSSSFPTTSLFLAVPYTKNCVEYKLSYVPRLKLYQEDIGFHTA